MLDTNQLYTIKEASKHLGVQYRALLNAVNTGLIPYYCIGKSRRLLLLPEVLQFMKHEPKETF